MSAAAVQEATKDDALRVVQSTALAPIDADASDLVSVYQSRAGFDAAVPIAKALAASTMVPDAFRNNIPNCLVAMELAHRTGASVLMVMQNLHIVKGKPGWSGAFLIASANTCGRFSPLRFEFAGVERGKDWQCRAVARDLASGDVLEGEWITWEMVVAEGWLNKDGSKWKTMPGQMFRYRSASFWVRTFAPELALGLRTVDEVADTTGTTTTDDRGSRSNALNAALTQTTTEASPS